MSDPDDPAMEGHDDIWVSGLDGLAGDPGSEPPPRSRGRARGRILAGVALLLVGAAVAVAAVASSSDDEPSSTRVLGTLVDSSLPATTTTVTTTLVPTTLPGGAVPTGCGDWDAAFSFTRTPTRGVTIYSDFTGWHVRLGPGGPRSILGTVTGQTPLVVPVRYWPSGVVVSPDPARNALNFSLTRQDGIVGFDFSADCTEKSLTFDVKRSDGSAIDPKIVSLGRSGSTQTLPVVAQRKQPPRG